MRQVKQHDHLESSLRSKIERHFSTGTDVLEQFLIDKRNPLTRTPIQYSESVSNLNFCLSPVRNLIYPNPYFPKYNLI